ncbi:GLPGLI family protein [Flavobacterium chuncheonense]|uniref:GLPGLI family protein n=1 Tax=Flavobacterium chuncheonense TaxID=2026653 RepID=A0ABW5YM77_9FLAO
MKKQLFLLATLFVVNVFAQNNNTGTLYYKATVGYDDWFKSLPKEMQDNYKKDIEAQKHQLNFTLEAANFQRITDMNYNFDSYYYTKAGDSVTQNYRNDAQFGKLIILKNRLVNWKLGAETKIIAGFECYKAESEYEMKSGNKTIPIPLIAWYCPQIPASFGPFGYGGLPGMILEFQERNVVYGVYQMDFTNHAPTIKIPKEGKKIDEAFYHKMIQQRYSK